MSAGWLQQEPFRATWELADADTEQIVARLERFGDHATGNTAPLTEMARRYRRNLGHDLTVPRVERPRVGATENLPIWAGRG